MDEFAILSQLPLGTEVVVRCPDGRSVAGLLEAVDEQTRTVTVGGFAVAFPEDE